MKNKFGEMIITNDWNGATTIYDWDGTKHNALDNIKDWMDNNWKFDDEFQNCFTVEYSE